jgi:hypothetical protein
MHNLLPRAEKRGGVSAVTTHYDKILIAVLIADNDVRFPIGRRSPALNRRGNIATIRSRGSIVKPGES